MARRKAIPHEIDTQYFAGVTPLWVPPGGAEIPDKYHEAVVELAKWAGPQWSENDASGFFLIRQVVIASCEAWSAYDWERDRIWIEERRQDVKLLRRTSGLAGTLRTLAGSNRFKRLKIRFVARLLTQLNIKLPTDLKNGDCIDAFDQSLKGFADSIDIGDRLPAIYGAIEYQNIPNSLPKITVAVALTIADRITFFRKDGHSKGTLINPHRPTLSPNLPWKAIALFASASADDDNGFGDGQSVQTLVESLARTVSYVRWSP